MSWRRVASTVGLALVAGLASGGCVAAAPLISAAISAAPLIGGRSVERTVGADRQTAWSALETALADQAFRVEGREKEKDEWRLRGVADDVTVSARLESVTPRLTRVSLRVETGGAFADRKTAEWLHDRIAQIVHAAGQAMATDAASTSSSEAIRSLEAEVRRLRTDINDRSRERQALETSTPSQPASLRIERSAIVSPPLSAAFPSAAGAVPPISVMQPASAATAAGPSVRIDRGPSAVNVSPPGEAKASIVSDRVVPARAADTLLPVMPVSQPGNGS